MKCSKCGLETEQNNVFCPRCGERLITEEAQAGTFAFKILPALRDPLFLVVCILLSVTCLMSLMVGSVPLINILITVFLWLTYAQANKDIADANHLRCVSGAVYAQYVISYVVAVLVLVMGVILSVALNAVGGSMPGLWDEVLGELAQEETFAIVMAMLPSVSGAVIIVLCAIVTIAVIVFNIFTMRYLHRFAKSVYRSIEQGTCALECVNAAKIVLFILGGFAVISGLSSLGKGQFNGFISNVSSGGCSIIAGLLVRKHLEPKE
jgi:hypothetical protein